MYVELHARSAFSFLSGASTPEGLAEAAAEQGHRAIALLDLDGVYGAARFHQAMTRAGLRAHVGAELLLEDGARLPVLARTRAGYQNLCRLITRSKLSAARGAARIAWADLHAHAAGLVCLTGGDDGPLARALARGPAEAVAATRRLVEAFGSEVHVELQRHRDRHEERRNQALVDLARAQRLPLVATGGVRYARPAERPLLDLLTCVREKRALGEAGRRLSLNGERHLRSEGEMRALFADLPEAVEASGALSERLEFTLTDLGYEFPRYPLPAGETMPGFLRARCEEGARERYRPVTPAVRAQLERELALIERLGLAGYFLIVWDIVRFCRRQGILVQGRGSAANSAVCYALGITAVDPVRMDLLFERFLSEERGEWPDIDLDLPSDERRERVIQYVYERYGRHGAAMTANVITYRGRSAAREVAKALGFDAAAQDRLAAVVGEFEYRDAGDTPERLAEQAGLGAADPRTGRFLALYPALLDLPRHLGQHSGGMVICQGRLDSIVPLEPAAMPGRVVVQWDKEDCADLGIVKVDLLGLRMMSVLEESLVTIRRQHGQAVDLAALPADDPAVYAALSEADTVGMFQVESRAQMATLPRLRPRCFYDVVVQVAIIRPGPIVGRMVHPYLRRRQGLEEPDCLHPLLEPVLERTLGVPLFQEQLLRMAMIAAGFSGGEGEELRRAFGFRRSEARMRAVEVKLRRGLEARGIQGAVQDRIVEAITSFALYGFPESHALSFALLAYASAYLKVHYPAAFTAAVLNNQPMGFYGAATVVADARRHGLRVLPVDATASEWSCTVAHPDGVPALRLGLRMVKGLSAKAAAALVAERARRPFHDVEDLARRVPALRRDELRRLAAIGALNALAPAPEGRRAHRRAALWDLERALRPAGALFEQAGARPDPMPLLPMEPIERLRADLEGTGLTTGPHAMAHQRRALDAQGIVRAADLARCRHGARVRIAGAVIVRQRPMTAHGFVFLSLEDETGIANAVLAPELFDSHRLLATSAPWLVVEGLLQNVQGVRTVRAERIEDLVLPFEAPGSRDFRSDRPVPG